MLSGDYSLEVDPGSGSGPGYCLNKCPIEDGIAARNLHILFACVRQPEEDRCIAPRVLIIRIKAAT